MTALTQERKREYQNYSQKQLNNAFIQACLYGHLEVVKYMLTSPELVEHADIHANNDYGFKLACDNGHLEVVKYLLTSPDLKEHADIHIDHHHGFLMACSNGHLDLVKYLLTSPDLKEHADIHARDDFGFQCACQNGHLDVVKYLLTSSDLKEHADIHADDNLGFQWACQNGHLEVVTYLLSFDGEQCIDFQETDYNLDWAIKNQKNDIILSMMRNLKSNNFIEYIECLPKIEAYDKKPYEQVKNIESESLDVNSQETSLFL